MKKNILLLIFALGAICNLTSCVSGYYCTSANRQYADLEPFGYIPGKVSKTGTLVTRDSWSWQNFGIYRYGLIVEVWQANKVIRRYDLRIPNQEIEEKFNVMNVYGEAVQVRIQITGLDKWRKENLVFCTAARTSEHWFLN